MVVVVVRIVDACPSVMDAFVADGEVEEDQEGLLDAFPVVGLPSELVSPTATHADSDHWLAVLPFPMIPAYQVSGTVGKDLDQDSFLHLQASSPPYL